MPIKEYRSDAKNKLVEMLVALKDVDEGDYIIEVAGDKNDAEKFVHRMRVELSRFRKLNAQNNKINKPFKILLIESAEHAPGVMKVTLRKSMQGHQAFDDVAEVFDLIGLGGKISG